MTEELWSAVDAYIASALVPADPALDAALAVSDSAGLPAIAVAPNQGKLLHILALMLGAKRILEIGTLGGYSTIWMARALPVDGKLITLEADAKHANVALDNIARAGLSDRVQLRLGLALDTLPVLAAEKPEPFDLIFIDADKVNIPAYFEWAERLARPGSAIIVDNVVRKGELANPANIDPNVLGVRRLHDMLAKNPRVRATTLQTVGSKGYDGITFAVVLPQ